MNKEQNMIFKSKSDVHISLKICMCFACAMFVATDSTNGGLKLTKEEQKAWDESPKSKEELDPETRKKYEMLRAEFAEAKHEHEETIKNSFIDNPLHKKAHQLRREASEIEQELSPERVKVNNYFKRLKGEEKTEKYRLRSGWTDLRGYEILKNMAEDPELRPFVLLFSKQAVLNMQQYPDPDSLQYKLAKDLLPTSDTKISESKYFEIYLAILNRLLVNWSSKYGKVSKPIELPDFVLDYLDAKIKRDSQFAVCNTYYQLSKPEIIETTKKRKIKIEKQLSELWPRWKWAETPEEFRNFPNAIAKQSSFKNRWLVIINVIVLALIVICLFARSYFKRSKI